MKKNLTPLAFITADDWGMSPGINDGILALVKKGVLRRVSCMAKGKYLSYRLEELLKFPNLELGLHFDLTFEKQKKDVLRLIWESFFFPSRIRESVLSEFRNQWSALKSLGINPSYMDGHHHIHLLPGVFSALLNDIKFAGVKQVRTLCDLRLMLSFKAPLVLLSFAARKTLRLSGISTLACWYPNLSRIGFLRFRNGIQALQRETEIIVHPALRDDLKELDIKDSYGAPRLDEYRFLSGLVPQS